MGHTNLGAGTMYYVNQETGEMTEVGQAVEATVIYEDDVEVPGNAFEAVHLGYSGEFTIDLPRKSSLRDDWFKYLCYHHYTDKITFMLGHLFKDVRIMDNVALWNMAEGLYKLDQVRKQKGSVRRDSVRQHRGKEFLSVFKG